MNETPKEAVTLSELQAHLKQTIAEYRAMRRLSIASGKGGRGKAAQQTANARADNAAEQYRWQLDRLRELCLRAAEDGIHFHDDSLEPPQR